MGWWYLAEQTPLKMVSPVVGDRVRVYRSMVEEKTLDRGRRKSNIAEVAGKMVGKSWRIRRRVIGENRIVKDNIAPLN